MSNLEICPRNFFDEAVIEASPAMEATLPVTYTQLTDRTLRARSTSTADQVVQGYFVGTGRKADRFGVFRHTGYGGKIRLQLYQNDDYTTQVYDSGVVDFVSELVLLGDLDFGFAPFGIPLSDPLIMEAPYHLAFTAVAFKSFKITMSDCQYLYWEIGRFFLGKHLEAPYNPKNGMQFGWQGNTERKRAPRSAVIQTLPGDRWPEFSADMLFATEEEREQWSDLLAQCTSADMMVNIFPTAGGRQTRDHIFNGVLVGHNPFAWSHMSINETTIRITGI